MSDGLFMTGRLAVPKEQLPPTYALSGGEVSPTCVLSGEQTLLHEKTNRMSICGWQKIVYNKRTALGSIMGIIGLEVITSHIDETTY